MPLATSSFLRTIIKAVEQHISQTQPRFRRGTIVGQASDPNKVLIAPSGENGVADGFEYPVGRSYTSATVNDPGGPHEGDDVLIEETTPNNPVVQFQLLTQPGDKPNRDSYPGIDKVSITQNDAKKLRAHAITVDHVPPVDGDVPATARDGMSVVSTFDDSLWYRSSGTWHKVGGGGAGAAGVALVITTTNQTVTSGMLGARGFGFGYMAWNTPNGANHDFDTGNYYDIAHTDRLTVQADGIYEISSQLEFRTIGSGHAIDGILAINKNDIPIANDLILESNAYETTSSGTNVVNGFSVFQTFPFQCIAGDYFTVAWFIKGDVVAGDFVDSENCWFSIKQIG